MGRVWRRADPTARRAGVGEGTLVCVFYDSECIPFELQAIYMCASYFFLNGAAPCVYGVFSCMCGLFFVNVSPNFQFYVRNATG